MRVTARLELIDKIGRELQARYGYDGIDTFLAAFGIKPPAEVSTNSKWVYSKVALKDAPPQTVVEIAKELSLQVPRDSAMSASAPRNWTGSKSFRLFISHISKDKDKATRLKECLTPYAISGFVAHEDIHPTLEWQSEIERALHAMDAFVAIHTPGFSSSIWTQQEIGFAVAKGIKIISLKFGEDPTGFISKHQALPRRNRTAEEIAAEIDGLLAEDSLTSARLTDARKAAGLISAKLGDEEIPF